jgi:uroporphyrin-III C-methyltransferase
MRTSIKPKVTLVGAGPGDPELITLKAILALNTADVVLYDALIDPVLLKHAPATALKIFVGKRVGKHSTPQEETNQLCVSLAKQHGHVVRLKGGDPFVFGRGAEEIEYCFGTGDYFGDCCTCFGWNSSY